jgi:hypothetical protein
MWEVINLAAKKIVRAGKKIAQLSTPSVYANSILSGYFSNLEKFPNFGEMNPRTYGLPITLIRYCHLIEYLKVHLNFKIIFNS